MGTQVSGAVISRLIKGRAATLSFLVPNIIAADQFMNSQGQSRDVIKTAATGFERLCGLSVPLIGST